MKPTIKVDKNLFWRLKKGDDYIKQPKKIEFEKDIEIQTKKE